MKHLFIKAGQGVPLAVEQGWLSCRAPSAAAGPGCCGCRGSRVLPAPKCWRSCWGSRWVPLAQPWHGAGGCRPGLLLNLSRLALRYVVGCSGLGCVGAADAARQGGEIGSWQCSAKPQLRLTAPVLALVRFAFLSELWRTVGASLRCSLKFLHLVWK